MNKKTLIFIIIFISVIIAGISAYIITTHSGGTVAVISVDGEEIERIDLSKVKESYDIEIETEFGFNLVRVEHGAISVAAADCPDLICVHQGRLTGSGIPIVCMPNRLVIRIKGGGFDA